MNTGHPHLYWCLSPNVGDMIGPYLFSKITGRRPIYAVGGATYNHFITVGSILNWANKKSLVWGAGLASWRDEVNSAADIRAVRGPISRLRAVWCGAKCPEVYGDPALLLPKWVAPAKEKRWKTGVVPHYVDLLPAHDWFGKRPGFKVIDPLQPVEDFVASLTACERIISSSLHGLIVADAYGIPNALVRMSDSIGGDGVKYSDYLGSVERHDWQNPPPSVDLRIVPRETLELPFGVAERERVVALQGGLLASCPFRP